jgi:hypothetical protein
MTHDQQQSLRDAVRDGAARAVGAVGVAGIGLIHLLDAPGTFADTRYVFWMYVALMIGSLVVAAELVRSGSSLAWAGAIVLGASAVTGFVLSRTTGLPADTGDIGNWSEPLGMASLWVEGCVVALGTGALAMRGALARREAPAARAVPARTAAAVAAR